jgi:hypothetical protein
MGKFRLNPLEKNNYFYGKLLTVRDFKSEQDYYTNKAQMVNRMLYGAGVVSGLKVSMIDGQTLSIESGLAIDQLGREIVIPKPITEKLAVIHGFKTYKDAYQLYLCLEYNEKGSERIHSISNEDTKSSSLSDYNRIKESYNLTLVDEVETNTKQEKVEINQKQTVIMENTKLDIALQYPEHINPGEIFYVEMILNKKRLNSNIEVELSLESDLMQPLTDNQDMVIRFKEPEEDRKPTYATRIWMIASNKIEKNGKFKLDSEKSKIVIDDNQLDMKDDIQMKFSITEESLFELNDSKRLDMTINEYINTSSLDQIYLARLSLVKTGEVYEIQYVEPMPYAQYVYDNKFIYQMLRSMRNNEKFNVSTKVVLTETAPETKPEIKVDYSYETKEFEFDFKLPQNQYIYDNIVTGQYLFEIDENFKFGKNFVSDELSHGLGKGASYIQVGLDESYDGLNDDETSCVYYGASEVFYKTDYEPNISSYSFGTMHYPNKGMFRIGMRLQSGKKGDVIKVRWWAYKRLMDIEQLERVKIIIEPSEVDLRKEESVKLTAKITGDSTYDIKWDVDDEEYGTIDEFGEFQATDMVGTVKVTATSNVDPTVVASAFITIKDTGKKDKLAKIAKV